MRRVPLEHWEYFDGELGGPWAVWRTERTGAAAYFEKFWKAVNVPHCATAADCVDPNRPYSRHSGWYRRHLDCRGLKDEERLVLEFGGLGQTGEVYVDLTSVYVQDLAYDAFSVDIRDAVNEWIAGGGDPAAVPLAVRVDNTGSLDAIPSDQADFHRHRGLLRPVRLDRRPPVAVGALQLQGILSADGNTGNVLCKLALARHVETARKIGVRVSVEDPEGNVAAFLEQKHGPWDGLKALDVPDIESVLLWHPDTPRLYTVKVVVESQYGNHCATRRIGFCRARFEPHGPFYLNGARLELRGTHRHEDAEGVGAAESPESRRREMRQIKDMGANAVRLGHYPQDDAVLDLCDELGLLVWEEIPWCRGGLGDAAYRERLDRSLRRMIERHRHHPCVLLWGLGNENDWFGDQPRCGREAVREQLEKLHALAKTSDPRRFTAIRRCDFAADVVDVYSPSIWAGWYRGSYREYRVAAEAWRAKVAAFVHAEWGGDSHAHRVSEDPYTGLEGIESPDGACDERDRDFMRRGGQARAAKDGDWSESYICDLFDWHLGEHSRMPRLTGSFQWIFKDFATPVRPDNPIPYVNQKGLTTRAGQTKDAYYVFQSRWASRPMVHIRGSTLPIRWGRKDRSIEILVDSNCERVRLIVDGEDCGERRRDPDAFPAQGFSWKIPFRTGDMQVVAMGCFGRDGEVSQPLTLTVYEDNWGAERALVLVCEPLEAGRTRVGCRVVDECGRFCLDSRRLLRFTCCGEAELPPGGGSMGSAPVVEAATGQAWWDLDHYGVAAVAVESAGLPTAVLSLPNFGAGQKNRRT